MGFNSGFKGLNRSLLGWTEGSCTHFDPFFFAWSQMWPIGTVQNGYRSVHCCRTPVYYRCNCDHSNWKGKKVKRTLAQALRLCTGRTANRESRGIAVPFHDHGTRRGWGVRVTPRPLFTPGKDPVPIVFEAGWAPGPVWTGEENLDLTGIRSPDRLARIQSLYRLT